MTMTSKHEPPALPWSPEAEQALLGCLLIDSDALLRISDRGMQSDHFFDSRHRAIWSCIAVMNSRRLPVDVVTVFEQLQDADGAEDGDSLAYLNSLAQCVPSATNVGRYADIVLDKAMRRAISAAADRAIEMAAEPGDGDSILDRVASLFAGIKRTKVATEPKRLGELIGPRMDHWQALADGAVAAGISTGLSVLDTALGGGIKPGKVVVLAARPSVGKTSLAQQIGLTVAGAGNSVLMLSQEMQAGELVDRAVANLGRVPLDHLTTGQLEGDDGTRIGEATDRAAKIPFFVDDQPALTLLDIRAKARQIQQRHGLALLIVDYVQLCAHSGTLEKRHHQIEQISRGMKQLAKELGICVLLLSQLNRERGEPELENLKESGAIEEDADTVILLHPLSAEPDGAMTVLAKIPKNRQGRRGRLALSLYGKTQRWSMSSADVSPRLGAGAGK